MAERADRTPVQFVKGVGPALAARLAALEIHTVQDLLFHIPFRYVDRRHIDHVATLTPGKDRTIIASVISARPVRTRSRRSSMYEVHFNDESGTIRAIWFRANATYMNNRFSKGGRFIVSGEVSQFGRLLQFQHPDIESLDESGEGSELFSSGKIIPVYNLTDGLTQKKLRVVIQSAWDHYSTHLVEPLPPAMMARYAMMPLVEALESVHFPSADTDIDVLNRGETPAQKSLIFCESLLFQLAMEYRRQHESIKLGLAHHLHPEAHAALIKALPFTLTHGQEEVIDQITRDMAKPTAMNRLLQGDVGSGKTVVAIAAAVQAVASGHQVAIMAPTEVLAHQHYQKMTPLFDLLGISSAIVTGSTRSLKRRESLDQLSDGVISVVIGTHALLEDDVHFKSLGLAVIDEQHRFGVMQRAKLQMKGNPDVLVMTATPIPRTLSMTVYGDMDLSILREKPANRIPIITKLYYESMRGKLYEGIQREIAKGRQAYIIYPLVEESEKIDLKNATDMATHLSDVFSHYHVGLIHGRMKQDEKDHVMQAFKENHIHLLVSTTVIEVGIDVANATVMVIECAERFGLSQLHQLRGRVGRGDHASYCILMAGHAISEEGRRRLEVMTATDDGFRIAEEDLLIRGPGDMLGTRQSGLPIFRFLNLIRDAETIQSSKELAATIVANRHTSPEWPELEHAIRAKWASSIDLGSIL